jgi:nucleoside-diphosphate-sugar epimerase
MRILVTGAMGLVGLKTVEELIRQNYTVRTFDMPTARNKRSAKSFKGKADIMWGDIRKLRDVESALRNIDAVIHLAAIIPPLADALPALAEAVNVGGTANILEALSHMNPAPRMLFTSSISVYGDRVAIPFISLHDELTPNPEDHYAHQKIRCESMIRASGLQWTIFRLSYIVSVRKLKLDPLMFDMPLATSIEICDSADAALALVNALAVQAISGETFHIAGGAQCRTTYREYLAAMLKLFGLGRTSVPEAAFKTSGFHCGYMDTDKSERLFHFQRTSIAEYFSIVKQKMHWRRVFLRPLSQIAQWFLFSRSPYLTHPRRGPLRITPAVTPGRLP